MTWTGKAGKPGREGHAPTPASDNSGDLIAQLINDGYMNIWFDLNCRNKRGYQRGY